MDNKNFSTSYIPLERPYQIIKYGKDVGMQIGTLVASRMLDGDEEQNFRIETHSYPVVAYANKMSKVLDKTFFDINPMEGVVWNRVELRDVFTLCLSNDHFTWSEYINLLWADINRTGYTASPQIDLSSILREFGVNIDLPPKGRYVVHLKQGQNRLTKEKRVYSSKKDIIAINLAWDDDIQKMKFRVMNQLMYYNLSIVARQMDIKAHTRWTFSFESEDDELASLVNILNTLERNDWDLNALTMNMFNDLPLKDQMNIISKAALDMLTKDE